jgi:glycerol-3-phosphate dehydrogenase (NAD(P)+)
MKITILGNGAFGSALDTYLKKIGHQILIDEISSSEVIFVSLPSDVVVPKLLELKDKIANQKIIICSKGFASESELLSEALEKKFKNEVFFLYGPTLAEGIEKGELSGMVLAGGPGKEELKKQLESEILSVELSDDVIGVQVGATLKNVVTIFIGIIEGIGCGENTQAYVFTKGLEEIKKIGVALGGKVETFLGLSCVGDLTLRSRNRYFGVELGKGKELNEVVKEMGHNPEGILALKNAKGMAKRFNIEVPLIELLYKIVFEKYPIKNVTKEIINI